jgi:hypothetical protein
MYWYRVPFGIVASVYYWLQNGVAGLMGHWVKVTSGYHSSA